MRILDLFFFRQMIQDIIGFLNGYLWIIFWILLPWWVSFLACDCGEALFLFVLSSFGGLGI
jgi:hypothetical protein